MVQARLLRIVGVVFAILVLLPAVARAQAGIAGVAKDTTGAVLPGVTVEAASPALIEKVRTVVTDGQGQYKIIDLRPGVYTVTFSLPGFSTVRREGIELSANFTASVNADLRVGELSETVTVSGQSPVVDVQNVVQQRVLTAEVIAALPSGRSFQTLAAVIPGVTASPVNRASGQDVGGTAGERGFITAHGSRTNAQAPLLDNLTYGNNASEGGAQGYMVNPGEVQEITFELGAISAEQERGGIRINAIPKEGGNRFSGLIFGNWANSSMQASNLTDELKARGLTSVNEIQKIWDVNPSFGGPLRRDKLWFFTSFRSWGVNEQVAGMYYDKNPLDFVNEPDLSRPAIDDTWSGAEGLRLTWQATPKNKFSGYFAVQQRCICHWRVSGILTPEASPFQRNPRSVMKQGSWRAPVTNRILLEAGALIMRHDYDPGPQPDIVTPDMVGVFDEGLGLEYRAGLTYSRTLQRMNIFKGGVSYVTGSHAIKVGLDYQFGGNRAWTWANQDQSYRFLNGTPRSIVQYTTPYDQRENFTMYGLFAQDQWTVKRLTLTGGLRFDHHNARVPAQHLDAVRFVGARDFGEVTNVPNWYDISPRLGAAYDLFGTGRTAVKVTLSQYIQAQRLALARSNNPVSTSVNSATRTWNDTNRNFVPDCNLLIPTANLECGAISPSTFGQVRIVTRYDEDMREGFGKRQFDWEVTAGVQHEVLSQVSVNATYFRRWYGNFLATDNLLVNPSDYDPYCVTAPADSRLPGGGGYQICGLYDINPSKFGQTNNLVTFAKNFGKQIEHYDGVDLTINARLPRGGLISGGFNVGRSIIDVCDVIGKANNPAVASSITSGNWLFYPASPSSLYCSASPPFLTQFRMLASIKLPWDIEASTVVQSIPGPQIQATYAVTSAQIRASLGRNFASGATGTASVDLVGPGELYGDRTNQIDVRLGRLFRVGRMNLRGMFDLYNLFNTSSVLIMVNQYGPNWQRPTYVIPARLLKVGVQLDF